jgi:hypothetical protein
MSKMITAGVLKRNNTYMGGGTNLQAMSFLLSDMRDPEVAYLKDVYTYAIDSPQYVGGVISPLSAVIPADAEQGIDFSLGDGSNMRQTRYFISGTSAAWVAALLSTAENVVLTPANSYTLIGG